MDLLSQLIIQVPPFFRGTFFSDWDPRTTWAPFKNRHEPLGKATASLVLACCTAEDFAFGVGVRMWASMFYLII